MFCDHARRFRPTTCLHAALCIIHTYSACQTCARALRVRQRCGPARGAQEHKTPVACGTLGAVLIGCLAIVLPPVAFWGELEINTLANPAQPLPHIWPQARPCAGTAALGQESAARARAHAWSGGPMLRRRREPGRAGCMYLQGPHMPGEACSAAAGAVLSAGRPQGGAWGTGIFCQGAYPAWMYALLGGAKLLAISISVCAGAPVWVVSMLCVAPSQWRAWGCCRYLYFYSGLKSPCQSAAKLADGRTSICMPRHAACQTLPSRSKTCVCGDAACTEQAAGAPRPRDRPAAQQPSPRPPAPSLRVMCRTICEKGALSGSPLVASCLRACSAGSPPHAPPRRRLPRRLHLPAVLRRHGVRAGAGGHPAGRPLLRHAAARAAGDDRGRRRARRDRAAPPAAAGLRPPAAVGLWVHMPP